MDEIRITPEEITREMIGENDIFVFGSNESGFHGAGAAHFAATELKFPRGMGFGMRSIDSAFAIPTKDWLLRTLPLSAIIFYVHRFIEYAINNQDLTFYVTKLGCGLAGYIPEDIAPMFKTAINLKNIYLPQEFWDILNQ